jgi:cytochrome c556
MKRLMIAALLALAPLAYAHTDKTDDPIAYRQAVYNLIGWHFSRMGDMVKGELAYDAEAFAEHARKVEVLSEFTLTGFETRSMSSESNADPKLWDNKADFEQKMSDFREAAATLAEATPADDVAALREPFIATADSCKSCHDRYHEE